MKKKNQYYQSVPPSDKKKSYQAIIIATILTIGFMIVGGHGLINFINSLK